MRTVTLDEKNLADLGRQRKAKLLDLYPTIL
jgi:hypothetical protein